ncbi:MAG TPA: hypothetical protein VFM18_17855 [Methanosarcina sp.]|nr:hypothetical protein [Methanosarcina sp.]
MEQFFDNMAIGLLFLSAGFVTMAGIAAMMYITMPSIREAIKEDFRR